MPATTAGTILQGCLGRGALSAPPEKKLKRRNLAGGFCHLRGFRFVDLVSGLMPASAVGANAKIIGLQQLRGGFDLDPSFGLGVFLTGDPLPCVAVPANKAEWWLIAGSK